MYSVRGADRKHDNLKVPLGKGGCTSELLYFLCKQPQYTFRFMSILNALEIFCCSSFAFSLWTFAVCADAALEASA